MPGPSQQASAIAKTLRTTIPSSQRQLCKQMRLNKEILEIDGLKLVSNGQARPPTVKEIQVLHEKFPSAKSVSTVPPMIIMECETLPSKPWPLTVAGLPLRFTENKWDALGADHSYSGGNKMEYLTNYDAQGGLAEEALGAIIILFETELQIAVTSIVNIENQLEITVPDDTDLSILPLRVANFGLVYKFASQVEIPQIGAMDLPFHVFVMWDRSKYVPLRPGTMVNIGSTSGTAVLATSGVAVEDKKGTRYFTSAGQSFSSKRFPCQNLGEPTIPSEIHHHLTDPNISIVKLSSNQSYKNTTFHFKPRNSRTIAGLPISGVISPFQLTRYSLLTMDSPFSGYCRCILMGVQQVKAPSSGWVTKHWMYFGTSLLGPLEGCAGTPILDKDGMLVSLLEHIRPDGFATGVAASEIERHGYKIVLESKVPLGRNDVLQEALVSAQPSVLEELGIPEKPFSMKGCSLEQKKSLLNERASEAWEMMMWDVRKGRHKGRERKEHISDREYLE